MVDKNILDWVRTQKRVTNGAIRRHFGVDEAEANDIYDKLKAADVIGYGGYRNPEIAWH